jgi:uracil-DNA glycosylase
LNWSSFLRAEAQEDYFQAIIAKVQEDAQTATIYPKREDIFNAFKYCPLDRTRAVILAQDPYHSSENSIPHAMGLSFSVPAGLSFPPSLRNIYKELESDLGIPPAKSGDLTPLARQGVLLLNSALTVKAGQAGSHSTYGWHILTDKVISLLNEKEKPVVFILWGNHAKAKRSLITHPRHLILEGTHPSGLSAHRGGFFGGKYFSKVNDFLIANGQDPIDWRIE